MSMMSSSQKLTDTLRISLELIEEDSERAEVGPTTDTSEFSMLKNGGVIN